jgi:hypothetical protein
VSLSLIREFLKLSFSIFCAHKRLQMQTVACSSKHGWDQEIGARADRARLSFVDAQGNQSHSGLMHLLLCPSLSSLKIPCAFLDGSGLGCECSSRPVCAFCLSAIIVWLSLSGMVSKRYGFRASISERVNRHGTTYPSQLC